MDNTQERKKILFISSEMRPFLDGDTPLAEIARYLPQKIQEKDNEVRILVPRFGVINERRNRLHEVVRLSGMNITIDDNDNPLTIKVASIPNTKMQVYFLDNEDFFHRKFIYNDENEDFFADNDERTIFFCKGALETVKKLGWSPDIIHCQGWMTSLIPLYIKTLYKDEPVFKNSKVIYSIFNDTLNETLGEQFAHKATLNELEHIDLAAYGTGHCKSLQLGGIKHADAIVNCCDEVDEEVANHLTEKMVMDHSNDDSGDKYMDFYDKVMSNS